MDVDLGCDKIHREREEGGRRGAKKCRSVTGGVDLAPMAANFSLCAGLDSLAVGLRRTHLRG